jgi:hypothetical protein
MWLACCPLTFPSSILHTALPSTRIWPSVHLQCSSFSALLSLLSRVSSVSCFNCSLPHFLVTLHLGTSSIPFGSVWVVNITSWRMLAGASGSPGLWEGRHWAVLPHTVCRPLVSWYMEWCPGCQHWPFTNRDHFTF